MMVSKPPLVSIIMNCYNSDRFLEEAIESIYAQTFSDWEIIFWDNASIDSSGEIARSYDDKLKYYRAENTTPLGEARNLAIEKASGKYLAFLDCDDLWLEGKLQAQMEIFAREDENLGFVYGRSEKFYSNGRRENQIFRKGESLPEGKIFYELIKENFVPFLSGVIDREKFIACGGFPKHFKNSTDYFIFLNLAQRYRVRAVQDVCCMYRIHENNLSRSQRVIAAKENIEIVSLFLPDDAVKIGLKHQYVYLALSCLIEKKIISAFMVLLKKGGWLLFLIRIWRWVLSSRRNSV
jgi:glycosyltransferase involved in cell wall biosynthesis